MRVAVKRNTFGRKANDFCHGLLHRVHRLKRQAVDQVKIHRCITNASRIGNGPLHVVKWLMAVYRVLHNGIEVLYAVTHPAETQGVQRLQVFGGGIVGVAFEAELMPGTDLCPAQDAPNKAIELFCAEKRGGSASEVKLADAGQLIKKAAIQLPFGQKRVNIRFLYAVVHGYPRVAGTIRAKALAKRQMNVQADAHTVVSGPEGVKHCS